MLTKGSSLFFTGLTKAIFLAFVAINAAIALGLGYVWVAGYIASNNQTSQIKKFGDGVTYDISFRAASAISTEDSVIYDQSTSLVKDYKGSLYYGNCYYGRVRPGDYVKIGDDMKVLVNGKERPGKFFGNTKTIARDAMPMLRSGRREEVPAKIL